MIKTEFLNKKDKTLIPSCCFCTAQISPNLRPPIFIYFSIYHLRRLSRLLSESERRRTTHFKQQTRKSSDVMNASVLFTVFIQDVKVILKRFWCLKHKKGHVLKRTSFLQLQCLMSTGSSSYRTMFGRAEVRGYDP